MIEHLPFFFFWMEHYLVVSCCIACEFNWKDYWVCVIVCFQQNHLIYHIHKTDTTVIVAHVFWSSTTYLKRSKTIMNVALSSKFYIFSLWCYISLSFSRYEILFWCDIALHFCFVGVDLYSLKLWVSIELWCCKYILHATKMRRWLQTICWITCMSLMNDMDETECTSIS